MALFTTKHDAAGSFTITLSSLASGSARQSTMVANASSSRKAALIFMLIESGGSAPTAGAVYEIFLLRAETNSSPTYRTDGAGASDAAITIENAPLLGTIVVTASTNKNFFGDFDTAPLGPLGTQFGIAVRNSSGQALHATEGNHLKMYQLYLPEVT